ncbi:hypothetical protein Dimus_020921 [Dionaea muscipula]
MPRGQREGGIRLAHDDEEDDFDSFRFRTTFHALISWPRFVERGIVSGRSVDLEQVDHKYPIDLLVGYGRGDLMDLLEVVYPDLVRMFYNNVELKGRGSRTHLRFYLKGKWYTPNRSMFASIFDIELRDTFAYFVTNADSKDVADNMGEGMLNSIIRVEVLLMLLRLFHHLLAHVPRSRSRSRPLSRLKDAADGAPDALTAASLVSVPTLSVPQTPWLVSKPIKLLNNLAYTPFDGTVLYGVRTFRDAYRHSDFEERVLRLMDSLPSLFRRRFPSPLDDP